MTVMILDSGRGALGLAKYLGRDKRTPGEPGPRTSDRVLWTATRCLPCGGDIELGARMMASTVRDQPILKKAADVSARGRKCTTPVGHMVLSWPKGEKPPHQEMEDAADDLLEELGYASHEAIYVCHDDNGCRHVHIAVNRISPVDGRVARDSHEQRRAQNWAAKWEHEHRRLDCPNRYANRQYPRRRRIRKRETQPKHLRRSDGTSTPMSDGERAFYHEAKKKGVAPEELLRAQDAIKARDGFEVEAVLTPSMMRTIEPEFSRRWMDTEQRVRDAEQAEADREEADRRRQVEETRRQIEEHLAAEAAERRRRAEFAERVARVNRRQDDEDRSSSPGTVGIDRPGRPPAPETGTGRSHATTDTRTPQAEPAQAAAEAATPTGSGTEKPTGEGPGRTAGEQVPGGIRASAPPRPPVTLEDLISGRAGTKRDEAAAMANAATEAASAGEDPTPAAGRPAAIENLIDGRAGTRTGGPPELSDAEMAELIERMKDRIGTPGPAAEAAAEKDRAAQAPYEGGVSPTRGENEEAGGIGLSQPQENRDPRGDKSR